MLTTTDVLQSENSGILKPYALIVDDEVDTCLLIKLFLHKKGIEAYQAHSLSEGLSKIIDLSPKWLFLDNNLPDGHGIDKIHDIKRISPETQIVMITALGKIKDMAFSLGVDKFIEKPLSFASIECAIN
jgi:DNA-binding response OmpR family regulator